MISPGPNCLVSRKLQLGPFRYPQKAISLYWYRQIDLGFTNRATYNRSPLTSLPEVPIGLIQEAILSPITQLDSLIQQARQSGFEVRYEYLGGNGGGICEYAGKRWLYIDLALTAEESWEVLREALSNVANYSPSSVQQEVNKRFHSGSDRKVA